LSFAGHEHIIKLLAITKIIPRSVHALDKVKIFLCARALLKFIAMKIIEVH
jgi:hypothetical protein